MISGTLSIGKKKLGFSQKDEVIHPLQSGFSMGLFIDFFYPEKIIIMGQWASNSFLRYICIQVSNLSKGIITLMTNKQVFYKIPEADSIYHTPGQDDTKLHSLNLQKKVQKHTTSSLSLPR